MTRPGAERRSAGRGAESRPVRRTPDRSTITLSRAGFAIAAVGALLQETVSVRFRLVWVFSGLIAVYIGWRFITQPEAWAAHARRFLAWNGFRSTRPVVRIANGIAAVGFGIALIAFAVISGVG